LQIDMTCPVRQEFGGVLCLQCLRTFLNSALAEWSERESPLDNDDALMMTGRMTDEHNNTVFETPKVVYAILNSADRRLLEGVLK
jgi:hypothetical protein